MLICYLLATLHVANHRFSSCAHVHLSFLSSLVTIGLCMSRGSLQYFPSVVHMNFDASYRIAKPSKQPNNCALRLQIHQLYTCSLNVLT